MPRLTVEDVPVDSLVPYPGNPRRGNVPKIADSLRAHGQFRPVVVQASTRYVVAGNHLLEAAKLLRWPTVAATVLDIDDDQARRLLLADNRTSAAGYDDKDDLAKVLAELGGELSGTAYDDDEVARLLARLDAAQAGPTPAPVSHGTLQLVWDDPDQRTTWNAFQRRLRQRYPDCETATARLIAHIRDLDQETAP